MIASSAYNTTPWLAGVVGFFGGMVFALFFILFRKIRLDDPMNTQATFGASAFYGGFLPGFVTDDSGLFW